MYCSHLIEKITKGHVIRYSTKEDALHLQEGLKSAAFYKATSRRNHG